MKQRRCRKRGIMYVKLTGNTSRPGLNERRAKPMLNSDYMRTASGPMQG